MTESEASQRWCPFSNVYRETTQYDSSNGRTLVVASASYNRDYNNNHVNGSSCLASRCMAWRWRDNTNTNGFCGLGGE